MAEKEQGPIRDKMKDKQPEFNLNNKPKKKYNSFVFPVILGAILLSMLFINSDKGLVEKSWKEIKNDMLLQHDVEDIVMVLNHNYAEIYLKKEALSKPKYSDIAKKGFKKYAEEGPHYLYNYPSAESFIQMVEDAQKDIPEDDRIVPKSRTKRDFFSDYSFLIGIVILVVIWLVIFRRMTGGAGGPGGPGNIFNVGKSRAKIFDKDTNVKVDFTDVAGLEEAKMEVMEIVEFLKKPKKYTDLGGKIPKGALLVGPPGTGKTLLAKAVAGEANVPFFSMSGSDFVEMFVGVGASRVRDLFKQAKEKSPCIIFIDEIDAIGRARGKNPNFGANDERENTLNQLLTEMDGFASNSGVIILAATNRADVLDRALLRAGRFDRQIHVELPDMNERSAIFTVHLKPLKLDKNLNVDFLAKQTPGFSGADIANVCNEAALIAARRDKNKVQKQDFLDAIDRIIGGLEKKNKIITQQEKRTIAYHEAGHATVSWMLEHASPLVKVTIIPRGKSLGAAWYLPDERQITTREQLVDEMCSALAGRASEEINLKRISTGALNDLEKVTKQAFAMVTFFGLSEKIGNKSYYDSSGQTEYAFTKPYSERTAELIDDEVSKLIAEQYGRAKKILNENMAGLSELAKILLEKEVIFSEDVEKIFGKRKSDPDEQPMVETEIKASAKSKKNFKTDKSPTLTKSIKAKKPAPAKSKEKGKDKENK